MPRKSAKTLPQSTIISSDTMRNNNLIAIPACQVAEIPIKQNSFPPLNAAHEYTYDDEFDQMEDEILFACDLCFKGFKYESDLTIHKRSHYNNLPYSCNFCSKSFTSKGALVSHKMEHIMRDYENKQCLDCKKSFIGKESFQDHLKCNHCPSHFKSCRDLNKHLKKDHIYCFPCKKIFKTNKSYLVHNQRKHSKDQIKAAPLKSSTSVFVTNVIKNISSYKEGENFKCDECEKTFGNKASLIHHKRLHFRKPFSCKSCFKFFTTKVHLEKHEFREHNKDNNNGNSKDNNTLLDADDSEIIDDPNSTEADLSCNEKEKEVGPVIVDVSSVDVSTVLEEKTPESAEKDEEEPILVVELDRNTGRTKVSKQDKIKDVLVGRREDSTGSEIQSLTSDDIEIDSDIDATYFGSDSGHEAADLDSDSALEIVHLESDDDESNQMESSSFEGKASTTKQPTKDTEPSKIHHSPEHHEIDYELIDIDHDTSLLTTKSLDHELEEEDTQQSSFKRSSQSDDKSYDDEKLAASQQTSHKISSSHKESSHKMSSSHKESSHKESSQEADDDLYYEDEEEYIPCFRNDDRYYVLS